MKARESPTSKMWMHNQDKSGVDVDARVCWMCLTPVIECCWNSCPFICGMPLSAIIYQSLLVKTAILKLKNIPSAVTPA